MHVLHGMHFIMYHDDHPIRKGRDSEWILQNQVSARRLELNKIIFRQIAPTLYDLVVFKEISIQRLKKAKMRMVTPKYGSLDLKVTGRNHSSRP